MNQVNQGILITVIFAFFSVAASIGQSISIVGDSGNAVRIDADEASGLECVYVVPSIDGVSLIYTSKSNAANVTVERYGVRGGAFGEPVTNLEIDGKIITIPNVEGDCGYIISDLNSLPVAVWIIDYSAHKFDIKNVELSEEASACDMSTLDFNGSAGAIRYYSINGRSLLIDRQIGVTYNTLKEEDGHYVECEATRTFEYVDNTITVDAPLCTTSFTITGDRFLKAWGEELRFATPTYAPHAVAAIVAVEEISEKSPNEQHSEGSAPLELSLKADVSDGAAFYEWEFSEDENFDDITLRIAELQTTHIIRSAGEHYVRFTASNADATCTFYSPTYSFGVGESSILCPNAFSPGNQDGVNDEWKVSYKSIISFECSIFNSWGMRIARLTHPSQGWDGKHNGRLVKSGTYYYVIKAVGADGKKYSLSGDINILNTKQ